MDSEAKLTKNLKAFYFFNLNVKCHRVPENRDPVEKGISKLSN